VRQHEMMTALATHASTIRRFKETPRSW